MKTKDFINRRVSFSSQMQDNSFALFYSGMAPHKTLDAFYVFTPDRNFYYLTGLKRENFYLLLAKTTSGHKEYLFIEEPSDYATKWLGRRMTKEEAAKISGIEEKNIRFVEQFKAFVAQGVMLDSRKSVFENTPEHLYLDLYRYKPMIKPVSLEVFKEIIDTYPELMIKDSRKITDELRRIKSDDEIKEIKKAIAYTKAGIEAILKYAKPGINENTIEAKFEFEIKLAGSKGISFDTIVASGKNATVLHYIDNNSDVAENEMVLLDLGALSGLYAADISRTFPVSKKFTERQKQFYQIVLDVNKKTIEKIKPGIYVDELNQFARDELAKGLMGIGKIKEISEIDKYYYHSVSHYLGIDVHDVGTYKKPLEPGVVLTVEPGLYIEEEGIGIRIEDDILVTKDGHENLSKAIIKEINAIEDFMK